jgi:hypothetical protein
VVAHAGKGVVLRQDRGGLGEVFDRWHFPGEVIEADGAPGCLLSVRADLHQAEVMVVRGAGGAQEGHHPAFASDFDETEGLAVELDGAFEVTDVEYGVVEAGYGDFCGGH